ncbi:MAG: cation:proton antiporter [Chloroflexi bacterium]|nr:cation:proton antiporter [Chloroflexota bacterium]
MTSLPTIFVFVVAVAAAFFFGALARRLRQPPVLGYLLAGLFVGPYVSGLITDTVSISTLAQLGVAFLMFGAGTELPFSRLRKMPGFTLYGPVVQLVGMVPLVVVMVLVTPWSLAQASYLGFIVALSSTTVVMKMLSERKELDTQHGRLAVAFSIVQDPLMIPAIVLVTTLSGVAGAGSPSVVGVLGALGKAIAFVVVAYFVGTKVMPPFLKRIASYGRELFLLCVVMLALGMAYLTSLLGLSLALGAFIAGLVVANSEVSRRALREVSPISDIFVTFFFVSVGMLLDIPFVLTHAHSVVGMVVAILVVKVAVLVGVGFLFRYPGKTALLTAVTLGQIGEEAFVLAQVGLSQGLLDRNTYSLVLAGAVISIIVSPLLLLLSPAILRLLERTPLLGRIFAENPRAYLQGGRGLAGHAIICGYGQVGAELGQALERRGLPYVVVDLDDDAIQQLRSREVPCILGDASSTQVLAQAGLPRASSLAITIPDPVMAERIVRQARKVRQGLNIVVRAVDEGEDTVRDLLEAGATEVVHPSFEASLGFIRCVLRDHGVPPREVERVVATKRMAFYG